VVSPFAGGLASVSGVSAYIDETGDRGTSPGASPIFGMAAVLVGDRDASRLRAAVDTLRSDFAVPVDAVLSWKSHVKTHDRRRRAVEVLRAVPGLTVCYVYAAKAELAPGTYRDNPTLFYDYVAFTTYESVVWAARHVGAGEVRIGFGHVKNHDHRTTEEYIKREASRDDKVPDSLVTSMHRVSADRYAESQAADLFGGLLRAATWPTGQFGYVEPSYSLDAWPTIRNSGSCAIPLGIMSMPSADVLTAEQWFPCAHCTKKRSR
jgi:hypothetical protein